MLSQHMPGYWGLAQRWMSSASSTTTPSAGGSDWERAWCLCYEPVTLLSTAIMQAVRNTQLLLFHRFLILRVSDPKLPHPNPNPSAFWLLLVHLPLSGLPVLWSCPCWLHVCLLWVVSTSLWKKPWLPLVRKSASRKRSRNNFFPP